MPQFLLVAPIPEPVSLQLRKPVTALGCRDTAIPAGMQMPKATVDENDGVHTWQ
jgi:hypothetical protein